MNNYIYKIISKENLNYLNLINIWAEKNKYLFNIERAVCMIKFEKNENWDMYKTSEYIINKMQYLKFSAVCGAVVNGLDDIPESYEQANFLLNYTECKNNVVYFIEDYILEFLILNNEANSKMILKNSLNIINRSSLYKETITAMSKYDMNINKACKNLSAHRNTIIYRMKKIKEVLGLDPINNHKDRIKFYILSIILNDKN